VSEVAENGLLSAQIAQIKFRKPGTLSLPTPVFTRFAAMASKALEGSIPSTLSTPDEYEVKLRPDPIPTSRTRPRAAPAARSRKGQKYFGRKASSLT
jgi:hypothetical protein